MRRQWARLGEGDFDAAWATLGPRMLLLLQSGMVGSANQAAAYVPTVLDELGIDSDRVGAVGTAAIASSAADGRELAPLLYQAVVRTRTALGQGVGLAPALQSGAVLLDEIVETQVADAGRSATSVAMTASLAVTGWVRVLSLPSCDRCVVLAGRFYRWSDGFRRHPQCDCKHVPATGDIAQDLTTDPLGAIKAGQVKHLSVADRKAIVEDGADPFQVINAKRGMDTAQVYGKRVKYTTEGTTARGVAGQIAGDLRKVKGEKLRRSQTVRLRPESIYEIADDRADALRLLRQFGYLR